MSKDSIHSFSRYVLRVSSRPGTKMERVDDCQMRGEGKGAEETSLCVG